MSKDLDGILKDIRPRLKPGNRLELAGQAALMRSSYSELIGGLVGGAFIGCLANGGKHRVGNDGEAVRQRVQFAVALQAFPHSSPLGVRHRRERDAVKLQAGRAAVADGHARVAAPRERRKHCLDGGGDGLRRVVAVKLLERHQQVELGEDRRHLLRELEVLFVFLEQLLVPLPLRRGLALVVVEGDALAVHVRLLHAHHLLGALAALGGDARGRELAAGRPGEFLGDRAHAAALRANFSRHWAARPTMPRGMKSVTMMNRNPST